MQDNSIKYRFESVGDEKVGRTLDSMAQKGQKAANSINQTSGAAGKNAKNVGDMANSTEKAADATDRAGRSQAQYFAHIARTTVQSALINKLFLEFVDVSGQAIQQVDLMNNFPATMASMGESTDAAAEAMDTLRTYVGQVGGNLGDATSMVTRFVGATGDVKAATAIFVGLNNALIAGDSSFEEQRLAAIQFAQALERGRPDMREWRALTQNMSFQLAQVAEAMGYVNANALGEALTTGEESMAAFSTTLTELSTGMGPIAQQAIVRMNGMQFAFNVLKNTMVQGLAAIINAFGRSNIVSFFSFLTQVVQVLTGWVVKLVQAFMWLINIIFGLFGLPAIQLKNDMEGVADAVGSGAGAAEDLGDGIKGAGKEAKKLQKSLAGFDKMNVLPDKESGSGGGGSGSGAGAGGAGFDPGQVGALDGLFGDLGGKMQEVSKWAKIFAGILAGILARRLIKKIFGVDIFDAFINAGKAVLGFFTGLGSLAKSVGRFIGNSFFSARQRVRNAFEDIYAAGQQAILNVAAVWSILVPRLAEQFRTLKANVINILRNLGVIDYFRDLQIKALVILQGLRDSISNIFQNIKDRIIAPIVNVAQAIANVFSTGKSVILAAVRSVIDEIVLRFNMLKIAIANAVSAVADTIRRAFETVKSKVIPVVLAVVGAIVLVFQGIKGRIEAALSTLSDIGRTIANAIKSGVAIYVTPILGPIADIGKTLAQGIIETTRGALGPFGDVAAKAISRFGNIFRGIGKTINPVIKSAFDSISGRMKKYGSAMGTRLKSGMKFGLIGLGGLLTGAFTLVLREGPEALVEKVNTFIQRLLTGPETILAIVESVKTMFATIGAQAETIINAVVQMITIFVNALIEYGPIMIETFFNAVLELISTLTKPESIDKILKGTITLITNVVKGIGKTLPKILITMLDLVVDLIEMITKPDMINMIIETTIDLLLKILLAIIDALPKIINGMVKLLVALIDVITRPDILDQIIDATIELILTIVIALIDNIDKLISAAVRLIVAIARGLWNNRGKILDAIKQIGARIISRLGEVDWKKAGKDIVRGLWNGISSLTQWVIDKVKGFGSNVLSGLKSFFKISSPSRIMRDEVGKMLGLGLAEGIEDSTKAAVNSAEKAADSVTGVFKNMQTDVGDVGSDFSVSGSLTRSVDVVASGLERVEPEEYRPYDQTGEALGRLMTGPKEDGRAINLTVKIGEDQIANKIIDLINEKTNMSGRNAIVV